MTAIKEHASNFLEFKILQSISFNDVAKTRM